MAISTAQEFLKVLEKSRLLSPEQMSAARQQAEAAGGNPRPVIESLLYRRLLTRWQVNQLMAGHSNLFFGKYKLLDKIGEGGMGKVFKAEHVTMGRTVALKVLPQELMVPETEARFRREVQMAASLHHPNIVTAYDADQVGKVHFLVMEYVEGHSLQDWIKKYGRLPIDWACECIRQAALGLDYAHRKGMIHRDIKPSNILVVANDTSAIPIVKILDMGLARVESEQKIHEEITQSEQVLGTPDYMSPEQYDDSRAADARSDIYSLGCTLFRMLTGEFPFGGKSALEKISQRLKQDAPRASTLRPELPPGLDAAIARTLARNPADRFQSCQELIKSLEPYASGTAGASEESSSIMLCNEMRNWSPSHARSDSALQDFLSALSNTPDQNTPAGGHSRTLVEAEQGLAVTPKPGLVRRKKNDSPKMLILTGAATVGLLLILAVLWALRPRPAVLTVQWLPQERRGGTLTINGREETLPSNAPITLELAPDAYTVVLTRRGYEPIQEQRTLGRGEEWVLVPKWVKASSFPPINPDKDKRPAADPKLDKPAGADAARLKLDWVAVQDKRKRDLVADQARLTTELKSLQAELEQLAPKATAEQTTAMLAKVLDFRRRWTGSDEAGQIGALLNKLPSPIDKLDRSQIPQRELIAAGGGNARQAPAELAWVFGDSRLKHEGNTLAVAGSPKANLVAVGTERGNIALWDPQTGELIGELKGGHSGWVRALAFSPDGRTLASGGEDSVVQLWSTSSWEQGLRLSGHAGRIYSVAFSRDGKLLASGASDRTARIWDVAKGDTLHTLSTHTSDVLSVAFDPQQDLLATGSIDQTAKLWNSATGKELHTLSHAGQVCGLAFTGDGRRLAAASNDGQVKLWDTEAGSPLFALNWDGGGLTLLAISPQRDRIAVGNSARIWIRSIADGTVRSKLEGSGFAGAAFSSDGTTLAVTAYGSLRLFDTETGQLRAPSQGHAATPRGIAFSPNGGTLYSTAIDETLQAWDLASGKRHYQQKTSAGEALAISPDGQLLALVSLADAVVHVLDANTGLERIALPGHTAGNYAAAFSPDGKLLATAGGDATVRIWDLAARSEAAQLSGPYQPVMSLAYGANGYLFAGYSNGEIYAWDVAKKEPRLTLAGHTSTINCLALHPSGQFLASGGGDGTIRIWDLRTAETMQTLSVPGNQILDIAFALDGQTLLSTSTESSIRFWDFRSGRQLRLMRMSDLQPVRIALSPEGRYLATGLRNGTLELLRIAER